MGVHQLWRKMQISFAYHLQQKQIEWEWRQSLLRQADHGSDEIAMKKYPSY